MVMSQNGHAKRAVIWTAVSSEAQATEDKVSLEDQEARLRAQCAARGWQVIDVLSVPGFSRHWHTWQEFMAAAGQGGIDAPRKLWEYWQDNAFDVLAVWTTDRLGRKASIHSEAISRTIGAGAIVFTGMDNTIIDNDNELIVSTMSGFVSDMEVRKLKKRRAMGMRKRALEGRKSGNRTLSFFMETPDGTLKPDRARYQSLFDALYRAFVNECTPYQRLSTRMKELGFVAEDGRRYNSQLFYEWLYTPTTWGNAAWQWNEKAKGDRRWVYDPTAPRPDGVEVAYGVTEPVWHGRQAEAVISEMQRRSTLRGRASPNGHAFGGLLICSECQRGLSYHGSSYRCRQKYRASINDVPNCNSSTFISGAAVRAYLDALLRHLLAGQTTIELLSDDHAAEIKALEDDICREDVAIERKLATVHLFVGNDALLQRHSQQLHDAQAALDRKRERLAELRAAGQVSSFQAAQSKRSLADIADAGVDAFWRLPEGRQNQLLRSLLGGAVLVVEARPGVSGKRGKSGQIIGVGVKA